MKQNETQLPTDNLARFLMVLIDRVSQSFVIHLCYVDDDSEQIEMDDVEHLDFDTETAYLIWNPEDL